MVPRESARAVISMCDSDVRLVVYGKHPHSRAIGFETGERTLYWQARCSAEGWQSG